MKQIKHRWYITHAYESFRLFLDKYAFQNFPTFCVHVSGNTKSPLNSIVKKKYPKIQLNLTTFKKSKGIDIRNLPFKDNSVDILLNEWVLEHVSRVWEAPPEIFRILKPGGLCASFVPFMFLNHTSHDYYRFTEQGLVDLFHIFEPLYVNSCGHADVVDFLNRRKNRTTKKNNQVAFNCISKITLHNPCANAVWGFFKKV